MLLMLPMLFLIQQAMQIKIDGNIPASDNIKNHKVVFL